MHSYEMSRQYSQYKSKIQASTEKKAAAALPNTPKTNTNENKKRKRVTPQSSPSDEGLRKKRNKIYCNDLYQSSNLFYQVESITQDIVPPDASNFQTQLNNSKPPTNVITIDTDDDNDEEASNNWKQPSSMKIESLISGVDRQNTEKL
jgi:hypothetical protein